MRKKEGGGGGGGEMGGTGRSRGFKVKRMKRRSKCGDEEAFLPVSP